MAGLGINIQINPPTPFPAAIAGNATYDSGVFMSPGPSISIGYKAAGATSYTFTRYLDAAKTLPATAAATGTGTGGTAKVISVNDGVAWLYGDLTITDTSGVANAISSATIVVCEGGH